MHIGLIGGIGPAATDYYHRRLIGLFARANRPLDLTIVHADAPTLLSNLAKNDHAAQAAIFTRVTRHLAAAGAGFVAVTSIAGHFCREAFKTSSPLPAVDMIDEVSRDLRARGLKRIGILGTRTVMETRFFGALRPVDVIPPEGAELGAVHDAYAAMAAAGVLNEAQRAVFDAASDRLIKERGAEAIMLGGTDLALVYDEKTAPFPVIDCAGVHADAIARKAMA